jgi:phosphoglycolate phosphatase
MYKCIIFDFDGTLADSRGIFVSVYNQIAIRHHYRQIDADGLDYLRTLSIRERCKFLKVPLYRIPFLASEFLGMYRNVLDQLRLFEGIGELIALLFEQGFEVAIISSNTERNIRECLAINHIQSIDKIYCSTSLFGKDKLIRRFLKKYGWSSEQVLYVGDEVRDIESCKATGVRIAWVDWGYDSRETAMLSHPDYVISAPKQILAVARDEW